MQYTKIKFTKEFQYHGFSEWMGVEAEIEPHEDPEKAILEARQKMIETFNAAIKETEPVNKTPELPVIDYEFEKIKDHLSTIEFREDAQDFLNTTTYSYTIEAKKLIANKPTKK